MSISPVTFSKKDYIESLEAIVAREENLSSTTDSQLAFLLDRQDRLAPLREEYVLPTLGDVHAADAKEPSQPSLYLCGNSLGPLTRRSKRYVEEELDAWGRKGVLGHWDHPHGRPWTKCEERATRLMADIVGAKPSEVVVMSTLTANLHTMLTTFYRPDSPLLGSTSSKVRHKIIFEARAFPSDQYALASAVALAGFDPRTSLVRLEPREGEVILRTDDIISIMEKEKDEAHMIMLGGIQYLSGQLFDIPAVTKRGKELGFIVGWDLAHAFANVPLAMHDWNVDFAVWCTYKYGSSGPGGIAGAFIHNRWGSKGMKTWIGRDAEREEQQNSVEGLVRPAGWWGHKKSTRFAMPDSFDAIPGAAGFQLSNPPLFDMASLLGSLETLEQAPAFMNAKEKVDIGSEEHGAQVEAMQGPIGFGEIMPSLRQKSLQLTAYLEHLLLQPGFLPKAADVSIVTPDDPLARGSQLSIRIPDKTGTQSHNQTPQSRGTGTEGIRKVLDVPQPISSTTLIARAHKRAETESGLITDIRNPDMLRLAPLAQFSTFQDVWNAADVFKRALEQEL